MSDEEKVLHEIASAKANYLKHFGKDLSDTELLALVELAYRERRDVWRKQQFYHIKSDLLCLMETQVLEALLPKEAPALQVVETPNPDIEAVKDARRSQAIGGTTIERRKQAKKEEPPHLSVLPNRKERKPKPGNSSKSP